MNSNFFDEQSPIVSDIETYVCLDLETTGLVPGTDMIIEIGAVKFQGKETLDTFHTLVNPGIPLPYFVSRLTGITQKDLDQAQTLPEISDQLISFIGGDILVGQSMHFDLGFLAAQGLRFSNTVYDTLEMAKIILPQLQDFSLASITAHFNIHPETTHRALDDAMATRDIFLSLIESAKQFDAELLEEIVHVTENTGWSLFPLFAGFRNSSQVNSVRKQEDVIYLSSDTKLVREEREREKKEVFPLDVDEVTAFLGNHGTMAKNMPVFEYRRGQVQMAQAVTRALNNNEHLIVEAGTGTGKSIAYLLPAMLFAHKNNCCIVVSTNTINLQEQLINKDIPMLLKILGVSEDIKIATLKGRNNYLCLRRWESFQQKKLLSSDERALLVRLLVWLHTTSSGDYTELNLNWTETPIWEQVCAHTDNCLAEGQCSYHRLGKCFLYRARQEAANAYLIVTNHALLVSDLITEGKLIPPYNYLIIDEAHHLEENVSDQFGFRINQYVLFNHLNFLIHKTNEGISGGLIPELLHQFDNISLASDEHKQLREQAQNIEKQVNNIRIIVAEFFEHILHFVQQNIKKQSIYERRIRLTPSVRQRLNDDGALITIWSNLDAELAGISANLKRLQDTLQDIIGFETNDNSNLISKNASALQTNAELRREISAAIAEPEDNMICWLAAREENNGSTGPITVMSGKNVSICAAPLHIGSALEELLFNVKKSVILTGATLSIENDFDYIKERLGLHETKELLLGCPFDYQTAALIYLPSDIPDPASAGYQKAIGRSLVDLCRASHGHALILFTSHSALRSIYSLIKSPLEDDNILVVGQGINGSARNVLSAFKSNPQTAVLGTNSLWEGIDIAGDALNVLVITRLPFNVPDDPVHQARAELFDDGFRQYTLPQAIIRFKQGFGRLIRNKNSRGMIVILDQRLQRKYYGEAFLHSLPPCNIKNGHLQDMPREVMNWI